MSENLIITEVLETKEYWLQQGLGKGLEDLLSAADVLIVPEKNFRKDVAFVFHQDTTILYRYLSAQLAGSLSIEICSTDNEYLEISLHSSSFRLGKILVNIVVAPLLVGLLTNYLYDEMKAKPTDNVEVTLVVEDHECRSLQFSYKGEVKDFGNLADKVGELAKVCTSASGKESIPVKENNSNDNRKLGHDK